jgi:hypothetical protein
MMQLQLRVASSFFPCFMPFVVHVEKDFPGPDRLGGAEEFLNSFE